jgi:hypothetical protein
MKGGWQGRKMQINKDFGGRLESSKSNGEREKGTRYTGIYFVDRDD